MDLAKVQAVAAFATTFFHELPIVTRGVLAGLFVVLLVAGFLIQPETDGGKNG